MGMINNLPANLKHYIENYGKNLVDGYIRFLEIDEIEEVSDILRISNIWNDGIPFATTVFGDVLSWEDGYIMLYKFTDEDYTVILSGTDFFFENLKDIEYQKDFFDIQLYKSAIKRLGRINRKECYILEPIPKLGGAREEKYLNIGKLKSYLQILV